MYALFPESFRETIGVPLRYESILHNHIGQPLQPSTETNSMDMEIEATRTSMPLDVTVPEELQSHQTVVFFDSDDNKAIPSVDYNANDHEVAVISPEVNDVTTAVALQRCSVCAKQFPKSKSHRGTRCWSCKKSHSRSVSNRELSPSAILSLDSVDPLLL